ncbi:hypothetical protein B0H14DRAFT_2727629, partial [Mycena olivaceomarginata]
VTYGTWPRGSKACGGRFLLHHLVLSTAFPLPLSLRDVQGGIPIPRFSTHIPKFTEISQKLDDIQYAFGIITKFLISYSILDTRPPWGSGCISTYPPVFLLFYYRASWGGV